MEGLRALQLTVREGQALAAALLAEGAHLHYAKQVPDHDLVCHILTHGGAIHVVAEKERPRPGKQK